MAKYLFQNDFKCPNSEMYHNSLNTIFVLLLIIFTERKEISITYLAVAFDASIDNKSDENKIVWKSNVRSIEGEKRRNY